MCSCTVCGARITGTYDDIDACCPACFEKNFAGRLTPEPHDLRREASPRLLLEGDQARALSAIAHELRAQQSPRPWWIAARLPLARRCPAREEPPDVP